MNKSLILLAISMFNCTSLVFSQGNRFDFSKVIIEKSDTIGTDQYYKFPNGIGSIFESKSEFEIRLVTTGMLSVEYQYLAYNKGRWYGEDINLDGRKLKLKKNLDYISILNSLLDCNFNRLTNQRNLTLKGDIDDGLDYFFIVKVKNKIRCIDFRNLEYFLSKNPDSKELISYIKLVNIIGDIFIYNWKKETMSVQFGSD